MASFLMEHPSHNHVGDLLWSWRSLSLVPERDVRLWEEGKDLAGFVQAHDKYQLYQVHPARGGLLPEMLEWGLAHLGGEVGDQAFSDDAVKIAVLEQQGLTRSGEFVELLRPLEGPIPMPALPPGFVLRHFAGEQDIEPYVALHREVWSRWGPSTYSVESHRKLMALPGFEPELVPIVVAPDGAMAAYCICWLDPVNCVGGIEPLGTRPAYRRMGLGRATVLAACLTMQQRGMRTALVWGATHNAGAQRLYQSAGFRVARTLSNYITDRCA